MELLLFMPMLAAKPCGSPPAEPPPEPELAPSPEKSLLCPLEAPAEASNRQLAMGQEKQSCLQYHTDQPMLPDMPSKIVLK